MLNIVFNLVFDVGFYVILNVGSDMILNVGFDLILNVGFRYDFECGADFFKCPVFLFFFESLDFL